jgi:quinol monooxygenase YgiN
MIKRIVKMSFKPEKVEEFKAIYARNWTRIRGFEGCLHVELLQAQAEPGVFFTYSHWQSEQALEAYRQSALFKEIWSATRILFSEKAAAWTVNEIAS